MTTIIRRFETEQGPVLLFHHGDGTVRTLNSLCWDSVHTPLFRTVKSVKTDLLAGETGVQLSVVMDAVAGDCDGDELNCSLITGYGCYTSIAGSDQDWVTVGLSKRQVHPNYAVTGVDEQGIWYLYRLDNELARLDYLYHDDNGTVVAGGGSAITYWSPLWMFNYSTGACFWRHPLGYNAIFMAGTGGYSETA